MDGQGAILAINPAVKGMFGYEAGEITQRNVRQLLPFYDQPETGRVIETTGVRKDGSRFPVDIQIGSSNIDGQELFVCSIRDITERKEQYDTLERLVEERTLDVVHTLESISDAFYAVDDGWRFTYINQEAERHLGKSRQELLGQNFWEALPDYSGGLYSHFQHVMNAHVPVHFEMASGNVWHGMHVYPSKNGLSVYFRDITERKKMEQDLRLSEERFRKIFNSSPSMIAIRSLKDGRYLDVNASWLGHTGYAYEEVVGHSLGVLCDGAAEKMPDGALFPQALANLKISYETKSGETREGLLSTETIEIQGETCLLSVITDITERSMMEKEMARLDRLNLVGEMAAGIAHEIRNPMTTVRGFLQLTGNQQNAPTSEYINLMVHELDRANSIITEFLTLAKNKTADKQLKNLNAVIEALYPLIQAEALLSDKDVVLDLVDCPELSIDEKEIRQMILNLALNGLEAMEAGKSLVIKTTYEDDAVVLEIRDQGKGIDPALMDKIGTPFFTTKEQGTGLGLAVCYSVAARHKAVIDIKTGDAGTSFFIRFAREYENTSL
jgi:PAS domain S-box-containing protein